MDSYGDLGEAGVGALMKRGDEVGSSEPPIPSSLPPSLPPPHFDDPPKEVKGTTYHARKAGPPKCSSSSC